MTDRTNVFYRLSAFGKVEEVTITDPNYLPSVGERVTHAGKLYRVDRIVHDLDHPDITIYTSLTQSDYKKEGYDKLHSTAPESFTPES